ncbi:type II toxin-antitoxin system RelE/ParE family toxin [Pseudomonas asiatica]|uniref:type II toxin-antitoxin system RelE/ParE family toxin n=1 Tax=Pseudomonas asiatica TaxID=2219225 RepID=UPI0032EC1644
MAEVSKLVDFCGSSKKDISDFPLAVRDRVIYQLDLLKHGDDPSNFKPVKTVGPGVYEIKIRAKEGAFRVFYVVNRAAVISVLHAFQKTTEKTEKRDIDLAKKRLKSLG